VPPLDTPPLWLTALAFLAVLGPLVFIHELGHYWVGRLCGIRAETFAIGFGRELFGWTDKRGCRWKVCVLPLGGYVMFAGDRDVASSAAADGPLAPDSFPAAKLWKRALTVAAGPVANFLLAIVIMSAFVMAFGRSETPPVIGAVIADSPAAAAGLQVGDRINSINGRTMAIYDDIPMAVMHLTGDEALRLIVERGAERMALTLRPQMLTEDDPFGRPFTRAIIGIQRGPAVITEVGLLDAPLVGTQQVWGIVRQTAEVLGQLLTGRRSIKDVGGPLKIAEASGQHMALGWAAFVQFIAFVSISLGFINLLPMPMLDGGHLLFYAIEAVRRRPVSPMAQEWAFRAGFAAIVVLMITVTFNDLSSFGLWQRLAGLIG
jgi:regulator of sigma E protease